MTELFLRVVNMSISASCFILVLLILRPILKKSPHTMLVLWTFVALRLICPFSIESAFSLIPSAQTIPPELALDTAPTIQSGIAVIDNAVNPLIVGSNTPAPGASINPMQITLGLLSLVWSVGMLVMLVYSVISYIRLRLRVADAVLLCENIYESDRIGFAFVLGSFRPRVYLPFGIDEKAKAHVIAHEQAHIRRLDHIAKPLGFLILTLHWFNPPVWSAYILFCRDIEFACDESVIRKLEADARADYSEALLSLGAARKRVAPCPLAFGESSVKSRVKAVLSYKKPTLWLIIISVLVCTAVALCFMTDPESAYNSDVQEIPLTEESANAVIAELLGSLTIHSDNTVSITVPNRLPVSEDGNTELRVTMNATYSDGVGSFATDRLLDNQAGWSGGEVPRLTLSTDKGELIGISLGAFYFTDIGDSKYTVFASGSSGADAPFVYDKPLGYTPPSSGAEQNDGSVTLRYTLTDGSTHTLSLKLPENVSVGDGDDFTRPLVKEGETVGSIALMGLGTTDLPTLKEIDTAADTLPMQIFAPVAMSNHAGYEQYTVIKSTDSGAVATAKYIWQDLSSAAGAAAGIPFQSRYAILAYDYEKLTYFAEIRLDESLCTEAELEFIAGSLTLE